MGSWIVGADLVSARHRIKFRAGTRPAPTILFLFFFFLPWTLFAFDSIQLKKTIPAPAGLKTSALTGAAVDPAGRLWVTDPANNQVHVYSADGEFAQTIGRRGPALGEFNAPHGIAAGSDGLMYVADSGNQRIQIFSQDGKAREAFGQKGPEPGQFRTPYLVAVSRDGVVLVADKDASRVQFFSQDGIFLHAIDVGAPIDGLAVDQAGRIDTVHKKLKQIEQWSSAGQLLRAFTGVEPGMKGFSEPRDVAASANGLLYVADPDNNQFRELDLAGHTLGVFGRSGSAAGQFRTIEGLAVQNETLYVCDSKAKRVTVLTLSRQAPLPALAPVPVARLQVSRKAGLDLDIDRLAWNPDGTLHTLSAARGEIVTYDLAAHTTVQISLKADLGVKSPSGLATAPCTLSVQPALSTHRLPSAALRLASKPCTQAAGLNCNESVPDRFRLSPQANGAVRPWRPIE